MTQSKRIGAMFKLSTATSSLRGPAQSGSFGTLMKKIKLSGREVGVLRAIDFNAGTSGEDLLERTHMELDDAVDIVNGLMAVGYVETMPPSDRVTPDAFKQTMLEVNPSFIHDLREAIIRR
jgi:hypothetical protein